jgi:hypothetical protein
MSAEPLYELSIPEPADRTAEYVLRIPMTAEQFLARDHGNRLADWIE